MNRLRPALVALALLLALVVTACGSSGEVPDGAVAVVDGTEIARSELDALVGVAKKAYAARDQEFPRVGTPEYQSIQQQYLAFLVQREEFRQQAEELGVEVTGEDVDDAFEDFFQSRFDGDREEFQKALEQQGFTFESFRETLEASVLSQKLFEAVTKDIKVSDQDILLYYTQNQASYETVDFPKSKAGADRIHTQLEGGADFAALARQHSDDPGSKEQGGKLTISRGQTVPPFEKTAFALARNEISQPIRTQFGFHVIQALSPVRPAKGDDQPESRDVRHILIAEKAAKTLDEVRAPIRQTLAQERRNEFMTEWVEDLQKRYESKISYATGFEPPAIPDETETQ